MKTISTLVFFILLSPILSGQNNSWSIQSFHYLDDAVDFLPNSSATNLSPSINYGRVNSIEKSFTIGKSFGFLLGLGKGVTRTSVDFVRVDDTQNSSRFGDQHYYNLYTGFLFTKVFENNLFYQLKLKGGAIHLPKVIKVPGQRNDASIDEFPSYIEHRYDVNKDERFYTFIQPEFNLGYNLSKHPFAFNLGLSFITAPGDWINGNFTYVDQNAESILIPIDSADYSDSLRAIGFSLGVHYNFSFYSQQEERYL